MEKDQMKQCAIFFCEECADEVVLYQKGLKYSKREEA